MCRRWREIPKPTIAMVQGACIAGGLMLAFVCDLIVAVRRRVLRRSRGADGDSRASSTSRTRGCSGSRAAKEILFTGDRFTAQRAYEWGMVNRVVAARRPRDRDARASPTRIAAMPHFGLALTKRAVNQCEDAMGMRNGMDSVFGLHHFAHAHNAEVGRRLARRHGRKSMKASGDLRWISTSTTTTLAFRDEVRAFLRGNVPAESLPSMDTAEGFAAHRAWEHVLADARLSVVSWPAEFGGRDATLLQWVVFEEEYFARRARRCASARTASSCSRRRCSRTARPSSWPGSCRRWRAPTRSGRRPGPSRRRAATSPACAAAAVRDRRRLAAVGAEDVVDARRPTPTGLRPVPHRPGRRAAPRPDLLPVRPARRRRHRPRHPAARRRAGLRRDLPRRRVRARRGRARRGRRGLAGRDVRPPATSAGCRCAPPAGSSPPPTAWSSCAGGCDGRRR